MAGQNILHYPALRDPEQRDNILANSGHGGSGGCTKDSIIQNSNAMMNRKNLVALPLILVLFLFAADNSCGQVLPLQRYTMQNGLLSRNVDALFQDSRDYLWIGTHEGLCVYDGATFTSYRTKDGLTSNAISCITESRISPGTIWIGTQSGGINLFADGHFTALAFDSIAALKNISVLMEDSFGTMWCGTNRGVFRIRNNQALPFHLEGYPNQPEGYPKVNTIVNSIVEASDRTIWMGNYGVIYVYSPHERRTTRLEIAGNAKQGIRSMFASRDGDVWIGTDDRWLLQYRDMALISQQRLAGIVRGFFEDEAGVLWICSEDGLLKMAKPDTSAGDLTRYSVENGLPDNRILAGLSDREGNLWFSVAGKGLCKWPNQAIFRFPIRERLSGHYYYPPAAVDLEGHFWVISRNGLLEIWQDEKEDWHQYLHRFDSPKRARRLRSVSVDAKGLLWIGFLDQDVHSYEITRRAHHFSGLTLSQELRFGVELPPIDIICFLVDNQRQLWLAGAPGIVQIDLTGKPKTVATYTTSEGLPWPDIRAIYQDRDGNLWFGGYDGGVAVLATSGREKKTLRKFTAAEGLPNEHVRAIHQDREGRIWLGTRFGGLAVSSGEKFRGISASDGLLSDTVWSIAEDDAGRLWLGTNSGLQSLEKKTGRPSPKKAILLSSEVLACGVYKNRFVWMATTEELAIYDLSKSLPNRIPPPVHLTQFRMNAQTMAMNSGLEFPHDQNTCTVEYIGISLEDEKATRYQYRLLGLAPEWSPLTAQRAVTFAELAPGTYTFEVKAINNDGVPSTQPAALAFTILPPFWQQWWFRILAGAIGIGVLAILRRYELNRLRLKDRLRLEQIEAEKLKELDHFKSRFFASISHEFRTPLTLMLGPVEKILPEIKNKERREDLRVMQRNARRLQRLVEQLLDLSRIEAHRMPLRAQQADIVPKIREWVASFVSLAESKNITMNLHFPEQPIVVYFDAEKLEKIVYNLLSNAFKFTPEGGEVIVDLGFGNADFGTKQQQTSAIRNPQSGIDKNGNFVLFTVKDTGIGIPKDHLPHIFDRFYRASEALTGEQGGTGIGLALAKEFVELHHGKIRVESEVGKGSTFTVLLPLGRDHLSDDEIVDSVSSDQYPVISDQDSGSGNEQPATSIQQQATSDKYPATSTERPLVLIVEDNDDMRRYLRNSLNPDFEIVEAENGEAGYQVACKKTPDLIVSDVMMPIMDGFALCEKLKTDQRTSHIPVILLTARAGQEDKLEGLEIGADDYLTKPFDARELNIRVKNLIAQRQRLRERFSREITVQPKDITVTSIDEKFLQQALDTVEENMSDSDFQIDQFCRAIGMSRSTLNRKLRALTGLSTNVFIRTLRLKRAAQLLEKKSATIVEIAYEVGFNNPSYFAECFRQQFGKPPSEWEKNG